MSQLFRSRSRWLAALALLVSMVAVSCGSSDGEVSVSSPGLETASDAGPVLDASVLSGPATTVNGEVFDLGDLAGTDLVVWFWAPW